jgi:glutathione synthase/RimK-type ligase-like ATP-grasp enzyme
LRLALLTCAELPSLTPGDRLLRHALTELGIHAAPLIWDRESLRGFDAAVLRSTWDYHLKRGEFGQWLCHVEGSGIRLMNSARLVRWNLRKIYLRELESKGVAIVPTLWCDDSNQPLRELMLREAWMEAVLKPQVSASAHKTFRVTLESAPAFQQQYAELCRSGAMLQPLMKEITTEGEWSLIFFCGEFSHAVLKTPAAGDYRVQHELGGSARLAQPTEALLQDAERVLQALPEQSLYARIDGVMREGRLLLMEAELIEPDLFLEFQPGSAAAFARAIANELG